MNLVMILATGFEELEAVGTADVLARLGITVTFAGLDSIKITGSHNMTIAAHHKLADLSVSDYDGVILPGGLPGATNLEESADVQKAIDFANDNGKYICAICAAPQILGHKGLLDGKEAIAYPGFESELRGAEISEEYVVLDGDTPLLTKQSMPEITGVAVVAMGVSPQTEYEIIKLLSALFDLPSNRISITK